MHNANRRVTIGQALELHRRGQFHQAERLYLAALDEHPRYRRVDGAISGLSVNLEMAHNAGRIAGRSAVAPRGSAGAHRRELLTGTPAS